MKNYILLAALVAVLAPVNAHALSIEQKDNTNTDGTPKFADPDEQAPPMLAMPNDSGSGSMALDPSQYSVNRPSVPQMMGVTQGSDDAFDHAAAHLQNQR
jgi:hypothetical protein